MKVYLRYEGKEYGSAVNQSANNTQFILLEKIKFQIMWELRKLEDDIVSEGGVIIINQNGQIETKNFTPGLTERITEILMNMKM